MESYIYRSICAARRRILSDICKISIILAQELILTDICWVLIMTDIWKHIWAEYVSIYWSILMYIARYMKVFDKFWSIYVTSFTYTNFHISINIRIYVLPLRGFTAVYRSIYATPPSVLYSYYIDRYMNYYIDRYMKVCICETRYIYRSKFVKKISYIGQYTSISTNICFHIPLIYVFIYRAL